MIKEYITYLKDNPQKYWFKAKLYGWGFTPATWQGWVVLLVHVTMITILAVILDTEASLIKVTFTFVVPVIFLTLLLFYICYKTGERPRWQWGPPPTKPKEH